MSAVHLTEDEIEHVTGYKRQQEQVRWLNKNRWVYTLNGRGEIVIGRWYADHRLAGMAPGETTGGLNLEAVR